jgi:GMP synthase (glutamine-hydrolysing)
MAWTLGGKVTACDKKEYGDATLLLSAMDSRLFTSFKQQETVWMSHGDQLSALPTDFRVVATTATSPFAAIECEAKRIYGIQFHPEVTHTVCGGLLLKNFVVGICEAKAEWTMTSFVDQEIERIRGVVGKEGRVIGAVSGGVDSSIAASLMHKAIGDRYFKQY